MTVPLVRLPSLDLLRGFVAVGRRMSITQAAADLCLTQSAVSRQVQALEDMLGAKLLVRSHRAIALTPEGERLFRTADSVVQQLQDAIGALDVRAARRPVTISASIGVTGLWLLPRLGRFQQRHPDIDVRVAADNRRIDLKTEGIDLAIRYCRPTAAPPGALRMFGESLAPVAHPALGVQTLDARSLANQFLIELDDAGRPWLQWSEWLAAVGWNGIKPKGILRFNQYDQVVLATVAGQGIALGRLELIEPMLSDGRLAVVSTPRRDDDTGLAYWLIQPDAAPRKEVRQLINWLLEEARKTGNDSV